MLKRVRKQVGVGGGPSFHGPIHVDGYLTGYSESFMQEDAGFISGRCSTQIPVNFASDKFLKYLRGFAWRDEAKVRPLGGRPAQVTFGVTNDNYMAEEYALEWPIDDRTRANSSMPLSPEEAATQGLMEKMMIRREVDWATQFFTSGIWGQDYVGGADFTLWDDATSSPMKDVDDWKLNIKRLTGKMPNKMVAGANVTKALRSNAEIRELIKYTQLGIPTEALIAQYFGVDDYVTASAIYNVAPELAPVDGDNLQTEFIVDENSIWLGYIAPTPALNIATAIATFNWTGFIPGANKFGGVIESFRDDPAHSNLVQARMAYDLKLVAADLGAFASNVVTPYSAN